MCRVIEWVVGRGESGADYFSCKQAMVDKIGDTNFKRGIYNTASEVKIISRPSGASKGLRDFCVFLRYR